MWLPPDHLAARLAIIAIVDADAAVVKMMNATEIAIAIMSVNDVWWSLDYAGYSSTDFANGAT